ASTLDPWPRARYEQNMRMVATIVTVALSICGCSGPDTSALVANDASPGVVVDASVSNDASGADGNMNDREIEASMDDVAPADSSFVHDGPSVFTFFHGIPNARALRLCFLAGKATSMVPLPVLAMPSDTLGLLYGSAFSAQSLEGADLAAQDIQPVVYTGAVETIQGRRCDELEAVPEKITRTILPVVPAGTLSRGRSVLMIAAGCAPMQVEDPDTQSVCGDDYSSEKGNVTMMVASMDRSSPAGAMGVQVISASKATEKLGLDHVTAFPYKATVLAASLSPGKIAPRPPSKELSVANLGTSSQENLLRVFVDNSMTPVAESLLTDALDRGGLSLSSLQDGKDYTVVVAGPNPGRQGDWFHSMVITVLPSDP
ncbi:MAG TPA: hypothetical protein PLJ27_26090, partial [Polyangiaceae bacterium]|nr:hypothetical protein [Polyangiaceae bacterium]